MSRVPMYILFKYCDEKWGVGAFARTELERRSILEAPTEDELPFEDEFLGHIDGKEVWLR